MAKKLENLSGDALKDELHRRSLDLIVVNNPLNDPYTVIWNTVEAHLIPAGNQDIGYGNGNNMVPRFVAEKYMKEMTDKILTMEIDQMVANENKKRLKEGKEEMAKYQGGAQFIMEKKTDTPSDRERIMKSLFVRIEREYAMGSEQEMEPRTDSFERTSDDKLFDSIMNVSEEIITEEVE